MAYIDLDEINRLHPALTVKYPLSFANGISVAISEINRLPNAKVVPTERLENAMKLLDKTEDELYEARGEIEKLTVELEAMRGAANSYKMHYENLAREIFEDIERGIAELYPILYAPTLNKFLAELKEKYGELK